MSKGGRYAKNNHNNHAEHGGRQPRSGKMTVLVVILAVLVLVVGALVGGMLYKPQDPQLNQGGTSEPTTVPATEQTEPTTIETTAETTEATTVPTTLPYEPSGKDILNILVVGQSARAGESSENSRLADTMILATINKNTKTLTLTSFLRDTYLKLPDYVDPSGTKHTCGKNRINVAYHLGYTWAGAAGSMEMMNQCLLENFGIEVDHNIEVDFDGFIKLIDLMGGVEIELTEAEAEYLNNDDFWVYYDVEPGLEKLDGMGTLSYARMRKAAGDSDSDIKRTERQRKLISAILDKLSQQSLTDLMELADEALPLITHNMTNGEILTCLWEVLPLLPELTIETGTCPKEGSYWGELIDLFGTQSSVLLFDEGNNRRYFTALTEGTLE